MDKGVVFSDVTWWCHPTPQRLALEAGLHSGYRLQLVWRASLGLWAAVVFRGRPVIHATKFRQTQGFGKNEGNISGGVHYGIIRKFCMWLTCKDTFCSCCMILSPRFLSQMPTPQSPLQNISRQFQSHNGWIFLIFHSCRFSMTFEHVQKYNHNQKPADCFRFSL